MSDRELLEAAARAVNGGAWHPLTHDTPNGAWNPLDDDGDALRLALRLQISIVFNPDHSVCAACGSGNGTDETDATPESTRRAIVRAAAAMVTR